MKKTVLFYTKEDCPLCDEAKTLLQLFFKGFEQRNIHDCDEWLLAYQLMIPVIVIDEEEIYGERICYEVLESKLN